VNTKLGHNKLNQKVKVVGANIPVKFLLFAQLSVSEQKV
jgi:hypothetical protein